MQPSPFVRLTIDADRDAGPGNPPPPPESRPAEASLPHVQADDHSPVRVDVVEPKHFQAFGGMRVPPLALIIRAPSRAGGDAVT